MRAMRKWIWLSVAAAVFMTGGSSAAHTYSESSPQAATPKCSVTGLNTTSLVVKGVCTLAGARIPSRPHYTVVSKDADGYSCGSVSGVSRTSRIGGIVAGASTASGTVRYLPAKRAGTPVSPARPARSGWC